MTIFEVDQFVLQYPSRPPDKLSGLYRGPLEIVAIDHPDIIKVKDLTTNKISSVHTSRLRIFRHPTEMTREVIEVLASIDLYEYYVDKIAEHEEKRKSPKNWEFKVR